VITNDFLTNPMTHLWHERASHYGIACSAALPLYVGEDVVGIFSVYGGEDHQLGDVEVALLTHLSADIAIRPAIHRACRDPGEIGKGPRNPRSNGSTPLMITPPGSFQISLPSRETWRPPAAPAGVLGTSSMGMVAALRWMLAIAPEARPYSARRVANARARALNWTSTSLRPRIGGNRLIRLFWRGSAVGIGRGIDFRHGCQE